MAPVGLGQLSTELAIETVGHDVVMFVFVELYKHSR